MFARIFEIRLLRTRASIGHFARRSLSGISNGRPTQWKVKVENLLERTDDFDVKIARFGFGTASNDKTNTQIQQESFVLFNDWRHILFKIPHDESKILFHSAQSIDKLLHIHLDKLLKKNTTGVNQDFQPSPLLSEDLTTGIYAWGRTATEDMDSPVKAEALFQKFLQISENSRSSKPQMYSPTSNMYSALVYCWSQAFRNDRASEKCLGWFQKIRANRSMTIDSATWNALLRIHVRQGKFSGMERNLLDQYSSLNDGYTFASLVEGWMNSGVPDGPKIAYEELQRGIAFCMEKDDQIPALNQLFYLYLTQSIGKGRILESERVMNQAIGIQQNHTELDILETKHFIVVMNAIAAKGDTDKVNELYKTMNTLYERGAQRLQPNYQVLVVVLSAIAKKQDLRSLELCEDLLSMIETYMVENRPSDTLITNHAYNVMLDLFVRSPHVNDRRERVEKLIEHMKQLSIKCNNPNLLPDKISYAALMKAIIKEGKPGVISDIEGILHKLEHSNQISMQPDRKIYAIVLETFFESGNDAALLQAKDLVTRMKKHTKLQPDRVIYTILIKIHSLVNDVHGSDEVLRAMIRAYDSGRTECRPNEEAFVTAMSTWEQSERSDSPDGAFRIFNDMVALYNKGNHHCKPSLKSFGKLMCILAKTKSENNTSKMQRGQRLFSEMEKYGVKPDSSVFNWYIRVCTSLNSEDRSVQRESWTEALATFKFLRENRMADSHTYNSMFHACDSLLRDQDDRDSQFRNMFSKCRNDGQVDRRILTSLKRFLPSKLYTELTTLDPRDNGIHMRKIPASWKKNMHRHKN